MKEILTKLLDLFLVSFPQNLANVIALYAFNKKRIEAKKFWLAMLVSWVAVYIIRLLPISYGIPSLLSMVVFIIIGVYLLKFHINKTVLSVFVVFIITSVFELIDVSIITIIWGKDGFENIMNNGFTNVLAGIPISLFLLGVVSLIYVFIKKHENKEKSNGETCEKDS